MRENENGNGHITSLIVGTVLGAAVGAGLALLYAPRSGKETRELLGQNAQKVKEKAQAALQQGRDAMRREVVNVAKTQDGPTRMIRES